MQMDELTQQNAALVEQATAASQAMAEQVRGLNQILDRYRVKEMIESAKSYSAPTVSVAATRSERRSANRPWASKESGRKRATGAAAAVVVEDVKNDNEWREF